MALYFIAILPPQDLQNRIQVIKNEASKEYESIKSLNSPPHITIIPPFSFSDEKLLFNFFESISIYMPKLEIKLLNFCVFAKRTLYIKLEKNTKLDSLHGDVEQLFYELEGVKQAKNSFHVFTPHITLLNRDITEEQFNRAWEKFRKTSFQARFMVSELVLLKHEGKKWNIVTSISLC